MTSSGCGAGPESHRYQFSGGENEVRESQISLPTYPHCFLPLLPSTVERRGSPVLGHDRGSLNTCPYTAHTLNTASELSFRFSHEQ